MKLPKAQHYIPKFYLKNFSIKEGKNPKIYVYDLKNNKIFLSSINKIAQENSFYNIDISNNYIVSIEDSLAKIESEIAPSLNKLIYHINPNAISHKDRLQISRFCALLSSRVPRMRETLRQMVKGIKNKISDKATPELLRKIIMDKKEIKLLSMKLINSYIEEFTPIYYSMKWSIGLGNLFARIHTSDNPLLKYNPEKNRYYGNLGLLCKYIQVVLPLTPCLCLYMYHEKDYPDINYFFNFNYQNALHTKSLLVNQAMRFLFAQNKKDFDIRKGMRGTGKIVEIL